MARRTEAPPFVDRLRLWGMGGLALFGGSVWWSTQPQRTLCANERAQLTPPRRLLPDQMGIANAHELATRCYHNHLARDPHATIATLLGGHSAAASADPCLAALARMPHDSPCVPLLQQELHGFVGAPRDLVRRVAGLWPPLGVTQTVSLVGAYLRSPSAARNDSAGFVAQVDHLAADLADAPGAHGAVAPRLQLLSLLASFPQTDLEELQGALAKLAIGRTDALGYLAVVRRLLGAGAPQEAAARAATLMMGVTTVPSLYNRHVAQVLDVVVAQPELDVQRLRHCLELQGATEFGMASFVTVLQALAAHADVAPALVAANRQICGDAAIFYQLRTLEFLTQSPAECDAAVAALQQLDLLGRGNAHLRLAALRLWRGHRHADLQAVGDGIDSLGIPLHHDRDYLQALRFLLAHDRDATALCRAAVQRSDAGDSASRVLALVS